MNTLFILKCHHCLESEGIERMSCNRSRTPPYSTAMGVKLFFLVSEQFLFPLIWFKSEVFLLSNRELLVTLPGEHHSL